jgi:hypothetical protein
MIYFAQEQEFGAVKIGYSKSVADRIAVLQRTFSCDLILLAEMEGDRGDELALHKRFEHLRIDVRGRCKHREWYFPGPDLMTFLGLPEHPSWENVRF